MPAKAVKSPLSPRHVPCPCDAGRTYSACCEPHHLGTPAPNAESLMRSRYSAYVLNLQDYLLATWAATTRPPALDISPPQPQWLGLKVLGAKEDGDAAEVEFVARYKLNGRADRLHERSRFVRADGRWYYVDGVFPDEGR